MDGRGGDRSGESVDKWGGLRDRGKIIKNLAMFGGKMNSLIFKVFVFNLAC